MIDKRQRNRCQYCRYMKCMAMGMKREGKMATGPKLVPRGRSSVAMHIVLPLHVSASTAEYLKRGFCVVWLFPGNCLLTVKKTPPLKVLWTLDPVVACACGALCPECGTGNTDLTHMALLTART